jgi:hypothetical protein
VVDEWISKLVQAMNQKAMGGWFRLARLASGRLLVLLGCLCFRELQAQSSGDTSIILGTQEIVEVLHAGATNWTAAVVGEKLGVGDQLRTGPHSRATIKLSNFSVLRVSELMTYEIEPPRSPAGTPGINIKAGSA